MPFSVALVCLQRTNPDNTTKKKSQFPEWYFNRSPDVTEGSCVRFFFFFLSLIAKTSTFTFYHLASAPELQDVLGMKDLPVIRFVHSAAEIAKTPVGCSPAANVWMLILYLKFQMPWLCLIPSPPHSSVKKIYIKKIIIYFSPHCWEGPEHELWTPLYNYKVYKIDWFWCFYGSVN